MDLADICFCGLIIKLFSDALVQAASELCKGLNVVTLV